MPKKSPKKILHFILIITASLNFYVWADFYTPQNNEKLKLVMFDVGQGDAIYFRAPGGQDVLIDGGPDKKVLEKLSKVMPFWDRKIEFMILTHPHADHVTGLNDVLNRYNVERVGYTGIDYETEVYQKFKEKIKNEGSEIIFLIRGSEIKMGQEISFSFLAPINLGESIKNINNSSIIGILKYKDFKVFLPGDAEVEEMEAVLSDDIKAQVLKASHHGSHNGVTEELLKAVQPEVVLVSVGEKNRYNHPHKEAIDLYEKFKANVLRTDEEGDIEISSDGKSYIIK